MTTAIGWELYRTFLGVLKEGSLSGAARSLGITQPTVGRHVSALESAFGATLFTRSQSGLIPTESALNLRGYAEAMESTAAALERAASSQGKGVRGVIRISASEVVGVEVLPPIVKKLRGRYPELVVELVLTNRVQNLLRRDADIAVRMVTPKQDLLIARRIGAVELGMFAHEAYLAERGTPRTLKELTGHAMIGYDQPSAFVRQAARSFEGFSRELFALRTDSDLAQLALIRSGAGIGVCQVGLARRDPALHRVLAKRFSLPLETWVTMHEDFRNDPRCRVTFDALVEGLQQYIG